MFQQTNYLEGKWYFVVLDFTTSEDRSEKLSSWWTSPREEQTNRLWLWLSQENTGSFGDGRIDNVKELDLSDLCLATRNSEQTMQKKLIGTIFQPVDFYR